MPGVVPALYAAHGDSAACHGRISIAGRGSGRDGFEVWSIPASLARQRAKLARFPATAELFLPGGEPLAAGALSDPDLGGSLRQIAAEGPAAVYRTARRAIADEMVRGGGILGLDDLRQFRPRVWDKPQQSSYRGYRS